MGSQLFGQLQYGHMLFLRTEVPRYFNCITLTLYVNFFMMALNTQQSSVFVRSLLFSNQRTKIYKVK